MLATFLRTSFRFRSPASFSQLVKTGVLAVAIASTLSAPAWAVGVNLGSGAVVIGDNGIGDLNPTVGILDFNQTIGNYVLSGTVDTLAGPSLVSLLGSPTAALRLTNFTGEAVGTPSGPIAVQFYDTVTGVFPAVTGADALDAYVGHATGAAVAPGTDVIWDWQGFISGLVITGVSPGPPPYFNPLLPPSSPPLPYTVVTHGPTPMGAFTNPVFGAFLTFELGANGDQLILPSSGELGFFSIPEPSTFVLLITGLLGIAVAGRRWRTKFRV